MSDMQKQPLPTKESAIKQIEATYKAIEAKLQTAVQNPGSETTENLTTLISTAPKVLKLIDDHGTRTEHTETLQSLSILILETHKAEKMTTLVESFTEPSYRDALSENNDNAELIEEMALLVSAVKGGMTPDIIESTLPNIISIRSAELKFMIAAKSGKCWGLRNDIAQKIKGTEIPEGSAGHTRLQQLNEALDANKTIANLKHTAADLKDIIELDI